MTEDDFDRLQIGDPVHWDDLKLNGRAIDILHGFFDKAVLIQSGDALIWASYRNIEKGEKHYEHKRRAYRKKDKHAAGRKR